jgi:SH3-like domain-containing protein
MRSWKRSLACLWVVIFSIAFVSACSSKQDPKLGTVLGMILDSESNEALADVMVSTGTALFTTSSSWGVFETAKVPFGPLTLSFQKPAYKPSQRMLDLEESKVFLQVLLDRDQNIALTIVEGVKLRSDPDPAADILEALSMSAKLVLMKEVDRGWYHVQYLGKEGWVWGGYLRSDDVPIHSAIAAEELTIFSEAGSGDELGLAYAGLGLIVQEEKGGWARILLPIGLEGWVEVRNLTQ